MELPSSNQPQTSDARPTDALAAGTDTCSLLEHYGIVSVPCTVYEWGGYRYSNSSDAIAAAKRAGR